MASGRSLACSALRLLISRSLLPMCARLMLAASVGILYARLDCVSVVRVRLFSCALCLCLCLSVCLSLCLCLSVCLSVCLSLSLSLSLSHTHTHTHTQHAHTTYTHKLHTLTLTHSLTLFPPPFFLSISSPQSCVRIEQKLFYLLQSLSVCLINRDKNHGIKMYDCCVCVCVAGTCSCPPFSRSGSMW